MTPDIPAPVVDPNLAAQEARASADQTAALQDRLRMDTASVMARYGSRMAVAGASTATPGTVTPAGPPPISLPPPLASPSLR
jgi:hypothetical protein